MPLQHDLTPQLRTRLSRVERAVGWFVMLALASLVFGFAYYVYHTAERKGWFLTKAPYYTYAASASGLKVGERVTLMGHDAGAITQITPMPADQFEHNIYVEFELTFPHYDYIWTDGSHVELAASGLLDKRALEVTRGTGGYPTYTSFPLRLVTLDEVRALPDLTNWVLAQEVYDPGEVYLLAQPKWPLTNLDLIAAGGYSNLVIMDQSQPRPTLTGLWNNRQARYDFFTPTSKYGLDMDESPDLTVRLQQMVAQVQQALPSFFRLTNQLANVLANSASLTSNLNLLAIGARPAVTNLTALTAQVAQPGALGDLLVPTNLNRQLERTLDDADATLVTANTNLGALADNLGRSLDHLAGLTSNLEAQVQANTNMLSAISQTIIHTDEFIQGLKRHWFLRSAFRTRRTNAPPPAARSKPLRSPKP